MDDATLAAALLSGWASAPLDPDENMPLLTALRMEVDALTDRGLADQLTLLLDVSLATLDRPVPCPPPSAGDDLSAAVNLLARITWHAGEAGRSPLDDDVTGLAVDLARLAEGSATLRRLGVDSLCASQAIARTVRFGTSGVSSARTDLLSRLFALPPEGVMPRCYLMALAPLAEAVETAGRADLWQDVIAEFQARVGDRCPGDILTVIASLALPIVSGDSRWYRAEKTWDQAEALLDAARTGTEPVGHDYPDRLSIDLGLAYLHNRDLDERPFLDVVAEVYDRLHARIQPESRRYLIGEFALFLGRVRVRPVQARQLLQSWVDGTLIDQATATGEDAERLSAALGVARAMALVLSLRAGDDATVLSEVLADGPPEQVMNRLQFVVDEGRTASLAPELESVGQRLPDHLLGTAVRLAGVAVLHRREPEEARRRFGELGGLGTGDAAEPEALTRLRFAVSQAITPLTPSVPEGVDPVPGVPLEIYSDDPAVRLRAMERQFGASAFMSADGTADLFHVGLPILTELYTRGIADIDERVVEASVVFARRIIFGHQNRNQDDEALAWARRVVDDLRHSTGPRAIRARVLALHDVVRLAQRPEAQQAADLLRTLLDGNDADYAIVHRALLLDATSDWDDDLATRIRASEEFIPLAIGAVEHDEYEQQDWAALIRNHALWLYHRHVEAGDLAGAVRVAGIFLDWPGAHRPHEVDGLGAIPLRLTGRLGAMDPRTRADADRQIERARGRLADLGPTHAALVETRGALNAASDRSDTDLDGALADYEEALPRYAEAAKAHLAAVPDADRDSVLRPIVQHCSVLFHACWRADHESEQTRSPESAWERTARAVVQYLRLGVARIDAAAGDDLSGMVRLAANPDVFVPLGDETLAAELYALLDPLVDEARDGDNAGLFYTRMLQLHADPEAVAAWEEVKREGKAWDVERVSPLRLAAALARLRDVYDRRRDDLAALKLVEWAKWWVAAARSMDAEGPASLPYDNSARASAAYLRLRVHELDPDADAELRRMVDWAAHPGGFVSSSDTETKRELYALLSPLVDLTRDDAEGFARIHRQVKGRRFGLFG